MTELPEQLVAPPAGGDPDEPATEHVEGEPSSGWTTLKVVGLVAAVGFVAVLLALVLQSRFDGEAADSVDVGFLQDMIAHHEQAIQLGLLGVANAEDPDVVHFAQEAIVAQQWEIGYMTAMLEDWGYGTGDLDREAMEWMDMAPTSVEDMPGMASAEELAALRSASGAEADELFLELMARHHVGGVHMAEEAAERANDDRVLDMAERMALNQQREIEEYRNKAASIGVELDVS